MTDRVLRGATRGLLIDIELGASVPDAVVEALSSLAQTNRSRTDVPDLMIRLEQALTADGTAWRVTVGDAVTSAGPISQALDGLIHILNERVIQSDNTVLSVHAAAVASGGWGLLLPADSGAGKSTLCARLLQAGCSYLTDESTGIASFGELRGYPKPLGLKFGSLEALSDIDLDDFHVDPGQQSVWQVPPARFGATVVPEAMAAIVAFPRFTPDHEVSIERLSRAEGALLVLSNAQNRGVVGDAHAMARVAELVARTEQYRVTYGEARDAAGALRDLLMHFRPPLRTTWQLVPLRHEREMAEVRPAPAADVVAGCFEDGALLLRSETGEMLVTGATGARVWPKLGTESLDAIVMTLAEEFGSDAAQVERDLLPWLDDLGERGFVEHCRDTDPM